MVQLSYTECFINVTFSGIFPLQNTSESLLLSTKTSDAKADLTTNTGYLFLVLELCLMVIILFGNGLTILAIITMPSLQTITYRSVLYTSGVSFSIINEKYDGMAQSC